MQKIKYWMMETLVATTNDMIVSVVNEVYNRARKKGEKIHSFSTMGFCSYIILSHAQAHLCN